MGLERGTLSSKKLVCRSTPKNTKLDHDEEEMVSAGLGKRVSPSSSEQSSTPIGMRIVVSLPEEEMPSPGDSSAEEVCSLFFLQFRHSTRLSFSHYSSHLDYVPFSKIRRQRTVTVMILKR